MKNKMRYYWGPGRIQDGKLDENCGRIIIYGNVALAGRNRSMDHNYLLRAFAARYQLDKDTVISKSIRLYYRMEGLECIVCGVRKIDNEMFEKEFKENSKIVKESLN